MTREELMDEICPISMTDLCYTGECCCSQCEDTLDVLLKGYEGKVRADAIDEFKNALLVNHVVDKTVVRRVAEQIKEQK